MIIRLIAAGSILTAAAPAIAAEDIENQGVDNIVVTATRTPVENDRLIAPVAVIDRAAIEASLALDLAELLALQTGIDIARNGGPGQAASLFIRGTESNHALVLINGVEINPATLGGAAVQNLSTEMIERVEIVRGPRSTLYGSEAVGGVINVITRGGQRNAIDAVAGAGTYGTMRAGFTGQFGNERQGLSINAERITSDGFPTLKASGDDRGYDNLALNVDATRHVGNYKLGISHWQTSGNTEYTSPSFDLVTGGTTLEPVDQDFANRVTTFSIASDHGNAWQSRFKASYMVDDIEQNQPNDFSPPESLDFARTWRAVADWQNDFTLNTNHTLSAGAYYEREAADSLSFGTAFDEKTSSYAIYAADQYSSGRHAVIAGLRYSDHDGFGGHTTWNIDYGFDISTATRLTAAAGRAFRAPDATDRFGFGGNPELRPEDANTAEIGVRHTIDGAQAIRVAMYETKIDDLIEFVFDPVTFGGTSVNIGKARIRGVEADYRLDSGPWRLRTGVTFMDPKDEATDEALPRRARRRLAVEADRTLAMARIGVTLLAVDERKDSGFSDITNAGYMLLGLRGAVDLGADWRLVGRIDNVLDADYETAAGFNSPGRSLSLSIRYAPTQ